MKNFQLSNEAYSLLKWGTAIFLPALATFVGTIGTALNWEHTQLALIILTAFTTFMGTLLGITTANYNAGNKE